MSRRRDVVRTGEAEFLACPKGHKLPHKTDLGECTPVFCPGWEGGDKKARAAKAQKALAKAVSAEADKHIEKLLTAKDTREAAVVAKGDAMGRMSQAVGRMAARRAFLEVPEGLDGAMAEEWAQKRAVQLLPDALAEIEYQLRFGDDNQRRDAARDVLDINGMRKREAGNGGGATIILNLGGKELPWAQKVVNHLSNGSNDGEKK